jgi:prolyl 4-hydroxylase
MSIFKFDKIFLTPSECDYIIDLSKKSFINPINRVNRPLRSTYFHTFEVGDSDFIDGIRNRISLSIGTSIDNITHMQVNRYAVGEGFPPHYDYHPEIYYTFLIYLNDNFIGGETNFSSLIRKISPKKGRAICWSNCIDGSNEMEYLSLHEALPVLEGEKWMIIAWVKSSFLSND